MNYKIDVEARGGLGDLLITFHETTAWEEIEALGPEERARVTLISHNPFADELFRWHPKLPQIVIVKSRHFFMEYENESMRRDAGVADREPVRRPSRERRPIRFYPSPEDLEVLDRDLPKSPFLAIAPSSSGMEIENRNLPLAILIHACSMARVLRVPVVFLGRTYQGPHAPKDPPVRPNGHGIIDLTDRLSVPGTAEVVKRSGAVLTAHSCLLLLSWYERKPNFVLYPPKYKWHDFDNPSPFGFGKDYPETVRMLFSEFRADRLGTFMKKNFHRGTT